MTFPSSRFPARFSLLVPFVVPVVLGGCGKDATTSSGDAGIVTDTGIHFSPHDAVATDAAKACEASDACAPKTTCEAIGSSCTSGSACCTGYCSSSVCACNAPGYACKADSDCCSGSTCGASGLCVSTSTTCEAIGSTCASGSACCSGYCSAGACACNSPGFACKSDADCCGGSTCGASGLCTQSFAVCQPCDRLDGGAPCGANEYCIPVGDFPPAAYCATSCGENTSGTCPTNFTCTDLSQLEEGPPGSEACLSNSNTCNAPDGGATYCSISCAPTVPPSPCPCANYTCQATSLGNFCISTVAPITSLCQPCGSSTPCPGGYECVSYGDASPPFCAPSCVDLTCPTGTLCTLDTAPSTLVCVPSSGSCADGGA